MRKLCKNLRTALNISGVETGCSLRSTKMVVFLVFLVFMKSNVLDQLEAMTVEMGSPISFLEPFVSVVNSGVMILLLPLLMIVLMADFPREGKSQYYYFLRTSKKTWLLGQILYAAFFTICIILIVLLSTVLLSAGFEGFSFEYSDCVTRYLATFPEKAGSFQAQLLPENIFNQAKLIPAVFMSAGLMFLYLFTLEMVLLFSFVMGNKLAGLVTNGVIILLGVVFSSIGEKTMWIFPMIHAVFWKHYTEYSSRMVFPLKLSVLYFLIIDAALIILSCIFSKRISVK